MSNHNEKRAPIPVITAGSLQLPLNRKNFIAVDGESIDNKYVLLGTSHPYYQLENKEGISTDEALSFLWSMGNNRHIRKAHVSFVGFYFSYDVEMICKDLPLKIKRRLFKPRTILTRAGGFKKDRVFYKDWELTYIKRKFFSVRRRKGKGVNSNGITIYDVAGFFVGQGSFIKVLEKMKINVPAEIIEGKAARSYFSWHDYQSIKQYNQIECELLVELMHRIYEMTEKQGLTPRRWYGSSAIANFALRKWEIKDYMRRTVQENLSTYFWDAITRAYFGGRIEAFKLGSFQNVNAYDINSAYPSAIALLPSTRENHFVYTQKFRLGFGCWHVRYRFSKDVHIGVFPFRLKDGSIKFPLAGEGWYWNPEVELAIKHWPQCVEVVEGYYIQDAKKKTPFHSLILSLYKARKVYKDNDDLTHWIIKIILNALYGKFAQKVGRADFKNFTWAGWITSHTRARLREAVIKNEKYIIAFSTDGIYSEKKLPLKLSSNLGGWDISKFKKGTILMSGVYLLEGEQRKTGERGYQALSDWDGILKQLNENHKAEVIVRLFIGFNMADNFQQEYGEHYLKFVERVKILNPFNLSKRNYQCKKIKDWTSESCESTPIVRLSGISNPIKTEIEFLTEDDVIFTDSGDEILWMLREG